VPPERNLTLTPLVSTFTYLGMLSVGAVNGSYGAALEVLRQTYSVGDAQIGLLGTAQTVGGVLGNLSTAILEPRSNAGQRMSLGAVGFALGAVAFALSSDFWLAIMALFVMGLGLGLFQVNYATLFSRGFGARSSAVMAVMSTSFAVGSIAGPTLAAFLGGNYRLLPIGFALLSILVSVMVLPARDATVVAPSGAASPRAGLDATAFLFAGMILLYVVAEQSASFWGVTHLEFLGASHDNAAYTMSFFWLALLVGRFVSAAVSLRLSSQRVMTAGTLGATAFLALAHVPSLAPLAYIGAGFCFAPVFPSGLAWLARVNPSSHATTLYLVSGSLGAALGIPLTGALKTAFGDAFIPTVLAASSLACALGVIWLQRRHQRELPSAR
jgi:fucose permease